MKRNIIDPNTLELTDTLVELRRVSKTVKGGRNSRFAAEQRIYVTINTYCTDKQRP